MFLPRAQDSREELREERRRIEEALQQEYAARRVRSVDHLGRAYATGRRKTSVARVWIWPGPGSISINRRPLDLHFPQLERRNDVLAPFEVRTPPPVAWSAGVFSVPVAEPPDCWLRSGYGCAADL